MFASGEFYAYPRDNFNNIGYALTTIFIVIIGEDWNWSMYLWVRAYGYGSAVSYYIAVFFFLLLMIMGNIVLFSLFTAILLNNFEGDDDEEEEEEEGKTICMSFKEAFGKRKKVKKIVDINGIEIDVEAEEAGKKEMQQIKEEA